MKTQSAVEPLESRIAPAALIGLDSSNHIVTFDSATPGTTANTTVTGLGAGETLVGIDFRPATGVLYGLTIDGANAGKIYAIDPTTGVATLSALLTADPADPTLPYTSLAGANFGVDFNPVADRLRVVSDAQQNLRINVDTGLVTTDTAINPTAPAPPPNLAGAAYSISFAGAATTALYDIDVANDRLVVQNPPNDGTLATVGALGVDAASVGGFDILSTRAANGVVTDTGFAALTVGGVTGLYGINLGNGAATSAGLIGNGAVALRGLTAPIGAPSANAFTIDAATNHLFRLNTATPNNTIDLGAITGLGAGESIIGFDFRPATGALYAVTRDAVNAGRVYIMDPATAVAGSAVLLVPDAADPTPYSALSGTSFGVDFNPVPDRLRVVSDTGQNLRIDVTTGAVTSDADLNGGTPAVFAAAYTNSFSGATATTLYDIDSGSNQLLIQNPPNNGTLVPIGGLGVDVSAVGGFDIRPNGEAFATLVVGGVSSLYRINLATGAATAVGQVGTGGDTLGFAMAPGGMLQFASATATVGENAGTATLTINRVGGSDGTVSVLVATANGTAQAGSDFTAVSRLLTFGPGVTSQTVDIPISNDTTIEPGETFTVTLTPGSPTALVNASSVATVTIADNEPPVALIGLDNANNLLSFNSASTASVASTTAVTGLGAGETLIGIDFRPATGSLYGITIDGANAGRIYLINPATGAAAFSSRLVADPTDTTSPYTSLDGTNFGTDFNPVPDRLRVVSDAQQNLRINVDTGEVFTDTNILANVPISGAAYSNSFAGAGATSLYDLDIGADRLVLQNPPNDGTIVAVGALGVDATGVGGFDIISSRSADGVATNTGFAALTVGGVTGLYSVNLATGAVSSFGAVGDGTVQLRGLTSSTGTPAAKAFTVNATNHLISFSTATPGVMGDLGAITGIAAGQQVIGFDFRPADGLLYLVTKDALNVGRIYTVNTTTAVATAVSTLAADGADASSPFTALSGTSFGVDFNPVPDRLRIVSDSGQNLRVNVATGDVTTDADLVGNGTPGVFAAGYLNSFSGAAVTTLYDLSAATDQLLIQNPPNDGALTVVGSLGVDATAIGGFDIRANGEAFATLTVGGVTGLYSINLQTGEATAVGTVGEGGPLSGLALAPGGALQFAAAAITVDESAGTASLTINRVGGSEGVVSVIVTPGNGTAVAGSDFVGGSRVVTFASGVTSRVIDIPLIDDAVAENSENFTVTLGETAGGAVISGLTAATVTITDNPVISIADVASTETNTGTTVFSFIVSLDRASTSDVTIDYATVAGTATQGTDYTAAAGQLTILAGQLTGTINVSVVGDTIFEGNETFTVNLSNPSANAVLGDAAASGTILNDDPNAVNPKVIRYTDPEGDIVRITVDVGTLAAANAVFIPSGTQGGVQLASLDLSDPQFAGANVTMMARRGPSGGDGFADIGYLNATGNTLGVVAINGDVGQVDAQRVASLTVQSIGRLGLSTQVAGGSLVSNFGGLNKLVVKSDIVEASIVSATGIGSATIRGNVIGGDADYSGSIEAGTRILSLKVLGSLIGGDGIGSGSIIADKAQAIQVRGDIRGGSILLSGIASPASPKAATALASLIVNGAVTNANILVGYDRTMAPVNADVRIGTVLVAGDWIASDLVSGIDDGADNLFGTVDDAVIPGGGSLISRIASINIRGRVLGTLDSSADGYGFGAERIVAFQTGLTLFPLTTSVDVFAIGASGDVNIREVAL